MKISSPFQRLMLSELAEAMREGIRVSILAYSNVIKLRRF